MSRFKQSLYEAEFVEEWHQTIYRFMGKIDCCPDYELSEYFKILIFALEKIFGKEQLLMENFGFPAMKCHLEQHARLLAALHHVHYGVMRGDTGLARRVGSRLLPGWFDLHTTTLDQALSMWVLCSKNSILTQLLDRQIRNKQKVLVENVTNPKTNILTKSGYLTHS
jgi:hemerythrin